MHFKNIVSQIIEEEIQFALYLMGDSDSDKEDSDMQTRNIISQFIDEEIISDLHLMSE